LFISPDFMTYNQVKRHQQVNSYQVFS